MTQLLKRWEESTFDLLGQQLRLKIKAPMFDEAPEFLRKMTAFGHAAQRAQEATKQGDDATAQGADSMYASLDVKWAREVFAKCVMPAEQIVLEDEGPNPKPIQTGAEVYEIANVPLVLQVLAKVQAMTMLGAAEGKASSSPSTSGAGTGKETAPDAGSSPATSTGPEGGTAP